MSLRHFSNASLRLLVQNCELSREIEKFLAPPRGRGFVGGQSAAVAIATSSFSPTERLALQLIAGG
jgi:hypothetical protein